MYMTHYLCTYYIMSYKTRLYHIINVPPCVKMEGKNITQHLCFICLGMAYVSHTSESPSPHKNVQLTTMTPFVDNIQSLVLLKEQAGMSWMVLCLAILTHFVSLLLQTKTHILSSSSPGPPCF